MFVICIDNQGFEDQLIDGAKYVLRGVGRNSYRVIWR